MISELTREDRNFIWQTVDNAVQIAGSHTELFENTIDLFETSGRFKMQWPDWLLPAKIYLEQKYSDKIADTLLHSIIREVMSEHKYSAYLKHASAISSSNTNKVYA